MNNSIVSISNFYDRCRRGLAYRKLRRNTKVETEYSFTQFKEILGLKTTLQECELALWIAGWCEDLQISIRIYHNGTRIHSLKSLPRGTDASEITIAYLFF